MKPKLLKILLAIAIMLPMLSADIKSAQAGYSREYVIDDTIFANSAAMSATDINNFLRSQGSWLADYTIPEYVSVPYPLASGGLSNVDARQFNDVTGEPLYNKTVAQLISDEAVSHGINPRIILTTLQKESSAITQNIPSSQTRAAWPLFYMYDEGMESCLRYGTSCDDAAYRNLSINYGGVAQQIAYATAWFRVRYNTYSVSQSFTVTIDGVTFTCQNAATRILYIYTPHILSWQNFHTIFTSWWEDPTYGPPPPNQPYSLSYILSLPANSWNIQRSMRTVSGNFNSDGVRDIAAMYDYGNESMAIFNFNSSDSFRPERILLLPEHSWNAANCSNLTVGNFDGEDGIDDIAVMYNYGNDSVGFWVFESSNSFRPALYRHLYTGAWNFNASSEISAGSFDQDNQSDIALLYDYGNSNVGLWVLGSESAFIPNRTYLSGPNGINLRQTKSLVSGNFDNAGKDDLAALYDYGGNKMGLVNFRSADNYRANMSYTGSAGGFSVNASSNLAVGNFDASDAVSDLAVMYDYGDAAVGLIAFNSVNSYAPNCRYWSGRRNFSVSSSTKRIVAGDFNQDSKDDITTSYTYGNNTMALFTFFRTNN